MQNSNQQKNTEKGRKWMGQSDITVTNWLKKPERFADLFNATIFNGEQVVLPKDLQEIDSESSLILEGKKLKKRGEDRQRDIIKQWHELSLVVLAVENQSYVNYAMPLRTMLYDSLAYIDQTKKIWNSLSKEEQHETKKGEYLSTFRKEDTLYPVITIIFYYGNDDWDAPLSLHDMFKDLSLDETHKNIIKSYVPDYKINLLNASNPGNLELFNSDLQTILGMLEYKKDKKKLVEYTNIHKEFFSNIDSDTRFAIEELLNADGFFRKAMDNNKKETGGVNMCQALDDLLKEGIAVGEQRGITIGEQRGITIGEQRGITIGEQRGITIGEQRGTAESTVHSVENIMANLGLSLQESCAAIGITVDEYNARRELLNNKI